MKLKLKGKLMIMFFLSITVPLTVLGVVSTGKAAEAMRAKSTESANKLVNMTAQNMEENIDAVIRDVSMLTNNPSIINLVKGNETSRDEVYNFLNLVQSENKEIIESLIITNDKGQAICTNDSKVSNIDFSDREYVKSTLNGEKSISKEILTSKITGDKIIAIAHPLMNSDKVMGTVIALVSFDNLTNSISNLKIGETGYGFMLDKDGIIIKHPAKEKEFNENLGESKDKDLKLIVEKMKNGETGSGYYKYNGVKKFVGFTYVGSWSVALTQNDVEIMEASNYIRVYTIIFTCIVIAISMVLVYLYSTRKIINPIKELQKLMGRAGSGDLTVKSEIKTKDEIEQLGESFNDMINNQSEIINNVRINASDLAASSEEISASTEEMSASTELVTENIKEVDKNLQNQNNMILETTEVLVDLSKLIKVSQNKAETTKNNSSNTMEVAKRGRAKVEETVVAINNINKATIQTEDALKSLEELSTKIVGIISTINSISEQTNLLALNAAIEAARAGENGRGFSVVADEVRTLSEESSIGAKEISVLVNSMVAEIKNAVATMGNGKNAVNIGVVVASETDKAFIDIIKSVDQMVSDIEQIVDVTKEEVSNSDKIVDLLKSVEKVCDNTAKSGHEVSVASDEQYLMISNITEASQVTSTMAMKLNELVDKFIIK